MAHDFPTGQISSVIKPTTLKYSRELRTLNGSKSVLNYTVLDTEARKLVSLSLTSNFSTNMAIWKSKKIDEASKEGKRRKVKDTKRQTEGGEVRDKGMGIAQAHTKQKLKSATNYYAAVPVTS